MNTYLGIVSISKLLYFKGLMSRLKRKPNKSELEKDAIKSYKSSMIIIWISTILFTIILAFTIVYALISPFEPYSAKRNGTVENGMIRYVQGELKYISLEELNIDKYSVSEGDKVLLYFDVHDNLKGGELELFQNLKFTALFIVILIGIVCLIILSLVLKNTIGKPFSEWYKLYTYGSIKIEEDYSV